MNYFERFDIAWRSNDFIECATVVLEYCNANLIGSLPPIPNETIQPISELLEVLTSAPAPIDNPVAFESLCHVIFRRIMQGTETRGDSHVLN